MVAWKRCIDISVAIPLLVVGSPVIAAAALALRLEGAGPGIYRGPRVGRAGRPFTVYKLRTMRVGEPAFPVAMPADARVTTVGHWLRSSGIDELPQLVNVLRGEMSLVGPRPASPEVTDYYSSRQRAVLDVVPGIVSPASTLFRHQSSFLEGAGPAEMYRSYLDGLLQARLEMDLEYVRSRSVMGDLRIIATAARAALRSGWLRSGWMQPQRSPTNLRRRVQQGR